MFCLWTNINSVRPNINTGRTNVNPVRPRVNTGSSNVNSVRSRKPVPTKTLNSFSPKRPQVNQFNQRGHFSKSYSSVRRPFAKTTAQMSHFHAVKGNWGSVVKTSAEFDKLVKHIESFAPINFEATKDSLKRFGEEIQTKTLKRLKSDESKDEESTKKTGKRRKQIARKELHSDKTDEDELEAGKDADPISAMLKDISMDDLTELYRIVMNRYGMTGPEDEFEKILWEYLKNMFEEPLSTDPVWSLIAMLDKKLQGGKPDEDCYKMLKMMEKQAGIRKHKDWLVQEQTALGKDFSNPLMADNLLKIIWLSTHHIWAFEQVADMKEPFDLSKVKGYRSSYKKDHTQASNDLATAIFPWLNEFLVNPLASIEALLSNKPITLQRPPPSKTQVPLPFSQRATPFSVLVSNLMSPPADASIVKPQSSQLP
ncbi:hypothetical protein Tco_0802505 [Tanacetum coccineum]|uniref:Uncharacterized protein n=1 Tax=Tanacetum coccineum TaxID=301880 RepID=A0ABQ4ZZW6_9ASTR